MTDFIQFPTGEIFARGIIRKIAPKFTVTYSRGLESRLAETGDKPIIELIAQYLVTTRWLVETTAPLDAVEQYEVEKRATIVSDSREAFVGSALFASIAEADKLQVRASIRPLYDFQRAAQSIQNATSGGGMIPTQIDPEHIPGVDDEPVAGAATTAPSIADVNDKFAVRADALSTLLKTLKDAKGAKLLHSVVATARIEENEAGEKVKVTEFDGVFELRTYLNKFGVEVDTDVLLQRSFDL